MTVAEFITRPTSRTESPLEVLIRTKFGIFVKIANDVLYDYAQAKEIAHDSVSRFVDMLISDPTFFDFEATEPVSYIYRMVKTDTLKYIKNGKQLVYATSLTSDNETDNFGILNILTEEHSEQHNDLTAFVSDPEFMKWLKAKVYKSDFKVFELMLTQPDLTKEEIAFLLDMEVNNVYQCFNRIKKTISLREEIANYKKSLKDTGIKTKEDTASKEYRKDPFAYEIQMYNKYAATRKVV